MAERKQLLKIDYISDHSCGMYTVGEIDTLPDMAISEYINTYGQYGYEQILNLCVRMIVSADVNIRLYRSNKYSNAGCEVIYK